MKSSPDPPKVETILLSVLHLTSLTAVESLSYIAVDLPRVARVTDVRKPKGWS